MTSPKWPSQNFEFRNSLNYFKFTYREFFFLGFRRNPKIRNRHVIFFYFDFSCDFGIFSQTRIKFVGIFCIPRSKTRSISLKKTVFLICCSGFSLTVSHRSRRAALAQILNFNMGLSSSDSTYSSRSRAFLKSYSVAAKFSSQV